MKTLVLSMISIAATVAAMTACTSEGDPVDEVTKDVKVPIELNAGIMEIVSKSVVNQGDKFDAQVIASATNGVYTTPLWEGATDGNISVDELGAVQFAKTQYYPTNESTIFMKGFAPRENVTNGVVKYTITGDKDIMISDQIQGSKTNATSKKLEFKHLLTQLQIKVLAFDSYAAEAWGDITAIEVVDASTAVELTLAETAAAQPLSEAVEKVIKNVPVDYNFSTALSLPDQSQSESAKNAGNVMVLPSTNKYSLLVKTTKKTDGFKVTDITFNNTEASKAYKITLTFKSTNIDMTASAGVWETVTEEGTGTVQ